MTRSKALRRPAALVAAGAASMVLVGLSAGAASAHTPVWNLDCNTVTVDLTAYNGGVTNHVTLTMDGQSKPLVDQDFKDSFHYDDQTLPAHTSPADVHLVVKAGDSSRYDFNDTKQSPVCEGQSTPPATPAPTHSKPAAPATTAPASSPAAVPSSAAPSSPAAVAAASSSPAGTNLAETGSSSSTPIIAGAAAVVVVAGAGILWASRRRRAAQH